MALVTVEREGDYFAVQTPYDSNYISELKKTISGYKWDPNRKVWLIPVDAEPIMQELLRKYFHYSGDPTEKSVTIIITAKEELSAVTDAVRFGPIPIAKALGRDSGAKVMQNVFLLKGKIFSGGSSKNWRTYVSEGSVFKVKNVPIFIAEQGDPQWDVQIVEEDTPEKASELENPLSKFSDEEIIAEAKRRGLM